MAEEWWVNTTGTTWKAVTEAYVNTTGTTWKEVTEGYVNTGGTTWKQFYSNAAPDPTVTGVIIATGTSGVGCDPGKKKTCVYWSVADGISGDTVDVGISLAGGSYVNFQTGIAYNFNGFKCLAYSMTGDAQRVTCDGCTAALRARVDLYRSSWKDSGTSGTVTICDGEA